MRKMFSIGALLFLLFSCQSFSKQEQKENVLAQPSLNESVDNAIAQEKFVLGNWPDDKWWEIFESEELSSLIETALLQNQTIREVKERLELATQEVTKATSKLLPNLFFNGGDEWQHLSKNGIFHALNPEEKLDINLIDLGFSFSYEFDFWGKYRNLLKSSKLKRLAKAAEVKQAELIVASSLAQSYFALKTQLESERLLERLSLVRKKYFGLQSLLQQRAILSILPQTFSKQSYLEARKAVAQVKGEISSTTHMINVLRGVGPDHELSVCDDGVIFCYDITIPETLNLELVARRPDLMAATFRANALAHQVGAAISDYFPNINLGAFARLISLNAAKLFDLKDSVNAGLDSAFKLPVYTAGEITANVLGKKAMYNQAVYEYNETLLKSTQEVADLLTFIETLFEQKEEQKEIVSQTKLRHKIVSRNYQTGLDDLLEVYKAEEQWILQQLTEVEITYAQYVGAIKLIKALGGGFSYAAE